MQTTNGFEIYAYLLAHPEEQAIEAWADGRADLKMSAYKISTFGNVRNKQTDRPVSIRAKDRGYLRMTLVMDDEEDDTM